MTWHPVERLDSLHPGSARSVAGGVAGQACGHHSSTRKEPAALPRCVCACGPAAGGHRSVASRGGVPSVVAPVGPGRVWEVAVAAMG